MSSKPVRSDKLKMKIEKLIRKYDGKNKTQEKFLKVNKETQRKLENLLKKASNENKENKNNKNNKHGKEIAKELRNIHKEHQKAMKELKQEVKREKKLRKQERKKQCKERKQFKKEKKIERKQKKEERKRHKEEKFQALENARIESLPVLKECNLSVLNVIIDGWNISGCDKIARKCMRGKRGSGATRMISLLKLFLKNGNYIKNENNKINIEIQFDGGKEQSKIIDEDGIKIKVTYSGKDEIVDDRLVRLLGKNVKSNLSSKDDDEKESTTSNSKKTMKPFEDLSNPNRSYLVVTSDRELTLRLNKIGVTVMKSGTFYKGYLKEFALEGLESNSDENNTTGKKDHKDRKDSKDSKDRKHKKHGKRKFKGKHGKKHKKHWKKYLKNRFSDNSTTSNSSSSSSSSSSSDDNSSLKDVAPDFDDFEQV